jgi:hypothetical protein
MLGRHDLAAYMQALHVSKGHEQVSMLTKSDNLGTDAEVCPRRAHYA